MTAIATMIALTLANIAYTPPIVEPVSLESLIPAERPQERAHALERVEVASVSILDFETALARSTWPEHRWDEVRAVAWCESRQRMDRVGAQGERGWLQIHPRWWPQLFREYDILDPVQHLNAARRAFVETREAFGGSGWRAWSCKP
jgi:hypothetical protein